MGLILNIETSTVNCSVALSNGIDIVGYKELFEGGYSHAEKLHLFIEEVISDSGYIPSDIDAIAVSKGPGSYTGLRIGVSAAKGLCYALNKPLISISTLESLAYRAKLSESGLIISVLDARRQEVYSAVYNGLYDLKREIKAEVLTKDSYKDYAGASKVIVVGNAANKVHSILNEEIRSKIGFLDTLPSSRDMVSLSNKKFKINDFEDVAYFEPYYLKDFMAIKPKSIF